MKVYLSVSYKEKDEAKKMGARWCQEQKKWYTTKNSRDCENLLKRWKRKESAEDYLKMATKIENENENENENKVVKPRILSESSVKPRFSASDVASLIGKNPYKTKKETLLKTLKMMPKFKDIILQVKKDTGAKSDAEIIKEVSPEIKKVLNESIRSTVLSTSEKEIDQTIQLFKEKLLLTIVEDTLLGKREAKTIEMKDAIVRINVGESTVKEECAILNLNDTKEVEVIVSEIQKQRGIQLEKIVEDNYTKKTSLPVVERNTFIKYECDQYKLIGYIDGMVENKVMETKNRKRFWKEPPLYDMIQLRCYMFMKGKLDGILYENFPEEEPRETLLLWDENEWNDIHEKLCTLVDEIHHLSIEEVKELTCNVLSLNV